jgi:hypothetical protein
MLREGGMVAGRVASHKDFNQQNLLLTHHLPWRVFYIILFFIFFCFRDLYVAVFFGT